MKLECGVADLSEAVGIAGKVCNGRYKGPLPLDCVVLVAKGEELKIKATNLETAIIVTKTAKVSEDGEVTVAYKRFAEILKIFPPGQLVSINVSENSAKKNFKMKIECGTFKFTVTAGKTEDYPVIEPVKQTDFFEIEKTLYGMFSRTAVAIADEAEVSPLAGMLVSIKNGDLILAATNKKCLSYTKRYLSSDQVTRSREKDDYSGIVSGFAVNLFLKLADDTSEAKVIVGLSDKKASFTIRNFVIIAQLLEGPFPMVEKVLPQDIPEGLSVMRGVLYQAIEAAAITSKEGNTKPINIMAVDNEMEIDSRDDSICSSHITLKIDYNGPLFKKRLDCRFALAILGSHMGSELQLSTEKEDGPLFITMKEDPSFIHLIMPLRSEKEAETAEQ